MKLASMIVVLLTILRSHVITFN